MSLISSIATVWSAGTEMAAAYSAAQLAYAEGQPVAGIVAAFVAETETEIDDNVARELTEGVEAGVEYARNLALLSHDAAVWVDANAESILARVRSAVDSLEEHSGSIARSARSVADVSHAVALWLENLLEQPD